VRTQFGWHIIKVTGRDKREIKIIDLALKIRASGQTVESAFKKAQDFWIFSESEGFEKAAENSKYHVSKLLSSKKQDQIPGIGQSDAVTNFAFANKLGVISEPIYVRDGVIVIKTSNIRKEGVRPLEEVKGILKSMAIKQKKNGKGPRAGRRFLQTLSLPATLF